MTVVFTTNEAEGALPNGARVEKAVREPGDFHDVGARGEVVGSIGPLAEGNEYGYWIIWDDRPKVPVFTRGRKVRPVPES